MAQRHRQTVMAKEWYKPQRLHIPRPPRTFPMPRANYSGGRQYSDMIRFNTDNDQLYSVGDSFYFADDTVENYKPILLPTRVNSDGTAIACELVRLDVTMSVQTATDNVTFSLYRESPVNAPTNLLGNKQLNADEVIITNRRLYNTAGAAYWGWADNLQTFMLGTPNKGVMVTSNVYIAFDRTVAGATTYYYKLWFKQIMLTTAAYVNTRSQRY